MVGLIIRIRGFSFFWDFPGGGSGWWEGGYWYVVGDGSSVFGAAGGAREVTWDVVVRVYIRLFMFVSSSPVST